MGTAHTAAKKALLRKQSVYLQFDSIRPSTSTASVSFLFWRWSLNFCAWCFYWLLLKLCVNTAGTCLLFLHGGVTYFVIKELHDKRGHAAVYTNEQVDAGQHHVSRAGHTEDEGGGVHHGGDGPPKESKTLSHRQTGSNRKQESNGVL